MPKKRIFLIGILLLFCLAGQWWLRMSQAASESPKEEKKPVLNTRISEESPFSEETESPEAPNSDDLRSQLIRQLLIMIGFVVLIGAGLWWFARKYSRGLMGGKGRLITVTETVPLGPRKTVHILQVGSRKLLIGSTSESIRFLTDVTEAVREPSGADRPEGRHE